MSAPGRAAVVALLVAVGCGGGSGNSERPAPADAALVTTDAGQDSCGSKAMPFVLPLTVETPGGEFQVTLTAAEPSEFGLGDNAWSLRVDDGSGAPVTGLSFHVIPWMTEHNHGAVKTVVVTETGSGEYEAKPISVNMLGIWDVRVEFPGDGGTPLRAVFPICAAAR